MGLKRNNNISRIKKPRLLLKEVFVMDKQAYFKAVMFIYRN